MATKEQYDKFKTFLNNYGLTIDQVEACTEKDYFKLKELCGGAGKCKFPLHDAFGWPEPYIHLFKYNLKRERPSAVWKELEPSPEHVSVFKQLREDKECPKCKIDEERRTNA